MSRADALTLRVLPGAFGAAEVVDLVPQRDADNASSREMLQRALWTHAVLCVRFPEPLDDAEARALVSMIGPVKDLVGRTRDGSPLRYGEDRQIIDSGFVMTDEIREALGDVSFGGDGVRSCARIR